MKILIIATVPIQKNGITSVIVNTVSGIIDTNIVFDVVCPNKPEEEFYDLIKGNHGNIYTIERSVAHPIQYIFKLTKVIKENGYTIIHVHGNSASMIMEMMSGIIGGIKVRIVHSHNTTCRNVFLHKILNPLFQKTYTYALACGRDAGKWLYGNRSFDVIKNGINVKKYAFCAEERELVRNELKIKPDEFVIGHVGVMNKQKNHLFLLEVFRNITVVFPKAKLILVGDGTNRHLIEQFIIEHNLEEQVFLIGDVNNVSPYLSSMDVIAMPSLYEGLPLTIIEEQANGLLCIVSDNITKEVDLSGNIQFLSLDNKEEWEQNILLLAGKGDLIQRKTRSLTAINMIIEKGYSITDEAEKVRKLYYTLNN